MTEICFDQRGPSMDCVSEHLKRKGIPLTRENYLFFAYLGDPPEELGVEEESMLPEEIQLNPPEEF
jgi:hypothetical protein